MTYCVGLKLNQGLVFMSDTLTNAGIDNVNTNKKIINKINIKAVIRFFFFLFIILFLKNYFFFDKVCDSSLDIIASI